MTKPAILIFQDNDGNTPLPSILLYAIGASINEMEDYLKNLQSMLSYPYFIENPFNIHLANHLSVTALKICKEAGWNEMSNLLISIEAFQEKERLNQRFELKPKPTPFRL